MTELLKLITDGALPVGFAVVIALILLAMQVPKILNAIKGDKIEGNVLDRIERHEKRMDKMDKTIHKQQVQLTRFEVVVLHLVGLLISNGVSIPKNLQEEIDDLTKKDDSEDEE